ncbi:MAG TPA: hypothetical protein VGH27_08515 [Streptosporangiaceae bacterium]|jgi:hypothetical protein
MSPTSRQFKHAWLAGAAGLTLTLTAAAVCLPATAAQAGTLTHARGPGAGGGIPWSLMALLTLLAVTGAVTVLLRWRLAGPGPSGIAAPSPGPAVPVFPYGSSPTPSKQASLTVPTPRRAPASPTSSPPSS